MVVAGIDVGSSTTKVVILKEGILDSYALGGTGLNMAEVVRGLLEGALNQSGLTLQSVQKVVATGYGRVNIPFAFKTVTEITCNAKGVHSLYPEAKAIIDIGGQDTKVIKMTPHGRVENFAMNDKCAAGTGRFLEVAAQSLGVDVEDLGPLSLEATAAAEISSMCTVFAQTEIVSLIARQVRKENIIAGLHAAIAQRVFTLFSSIHPEGKVVLTGGVARNAGVVKALQDHLRDPLLVPKEPQITTALGAALFASEYATA